MYELSTIISNLFKNAIEASERLLPEQRRIEIKIGSNGGMFYIEMENTCDSSVESSKTLVTTKLDVRNHGIGLKNVSDVVNKYSGKMSYECVDGVYRIEIRV